MTAPTPVVTAELRSLLRRVKLGKALNTLPERLALAHSRGLGHAEFLNHPGFVGGWVVTQRPRLGRLAGPDRTGSRTRRGSACRSRCGAGRC